MAEWVEIWYVRRCGGAGWERRRDDRGCTLIAVVERAMDTCTSRHAVQNDTLYRDMKKDEIGSKVEFKICSTVVQGCKEASGVKKYHPIRTLVHLYWYNVCTCL